MPIDTLQLTVPADDIYVRDNYAYLACGGYGIQIIDLSNIGNLEVVSEYYTGGKVDKVLVDGQCLYASDWKKGVLVFDISFPEDRVLTASYKTSDWVFDIGVNGQYVYAVDDYNGLFILRFVP